MEKSVFTKQEITEKIGNLYFVSNAMECDNGWIIKLKKGSNPSLMLNFLNAYILALLGYEIAFADYESLNTIIREVRNDR